MNKTLEKQIDFILERLRLSDANENSEFTINLSVYDDEALRELRPQEVWANGAEEHRKMMKYVSAVINRKYPKMKVNLVEIKLADYQLWLKANGLIDDEALRAKYITLKTNGQT